VSQYRQRMSSKLPGVSSVLGVCSSCSSFGVVCLVTRIFLWKRSRFRISFLIFLSTHVDVSLGLAVL